MGSVMDNRSERDADDYREMWMKKLDENKRLTTDLVAEKASHVLTRQQRDEALVTFDASIDGTPYAQARDEAEKLRADVSSMSSAIGELKAALADKERELEEVKTALSWVGQIHPSTNAEGGGAIFHTTWQEWNTLRVIMGLREQKAHHAGKKITVSHKVLLELEDRATLAMKRTKERK